MLSVCAADFYLITEGQDSVLGMMGDWIHQKWYPQAHMDQKNTSMSYTMRESSQISCLQGLLLWSPVLPRNFLNIGLGHS